MFQSIKQKISAQSRRKFFIAVLCVAILTSMLGPISQWMWAQQPEGVLMLQAPPFVNVASAQGGTPFTDEEIGIAAYINAGVTIDLNQVKTIYRAIDVQTATYIIGSISVPIDDPNNPYSYDENKDPKVYIHVDGWIMAYYHEDEWVTKIIDWLNYDGGTTIPTTLEKVLDVAATRVASRIFAPTYYNFEFPNANRMMLIADQAPGTEPDSFEINLPSTFTYYERSVSVGGATTANTSVNVVLSISGTQIANESFIRSSWSTSEVEVIGQQLPSDSLQTVSVNTSSSRYTDRIVAGLALVYQE